MWDSLAEINSVRPIDMDEYHSRPDHRILEAVGKREDDIVIYGARGKFSRHVTLMLIRAIAETNTTKRKVHLISTPRPDKDFDDRIKPYMDFVYQHYIDLINAKERDLENIPRDTAWVLYLAGYKFAKPGEGDRDYALKCDLYGMVIPSLIFTHHQENCDIVVMGSYNGLKKTTVDKPSKDHEPLQPLPENHYGQSIMNKERVIHAILSGREHKNPSRAVILRGGYYTDSSTYGGFETEILNIINHKAIDLSEKAYFNLLSHRDAAIATILSVKLASEDVSTFNLSGHLVDVQKEAYRISEEIRKYDSYSDVELKFTGKPGDTHLLADGSALEGLLGKPLDTVADIIHAHVYWIMNSGYLRGIKHKIGENI